MRKTSRPLCRVPTPSPDIVEGNLKSHGVQDREVIWDGVTIEPAAVFDEIKMSQTLFRNGGGLRTAKDVPTRGYFMVELTDFMKGSPCDLTLAGGTFEMTTTCSDEPVRVVAVDDPRTKGNTVKAEIRGCIQEGRFECAGHEGRVGLRGGLELRSANEQIVRLSRLGGALAAVHDWRKGLIFDGNKVDARRLELTAPVPGRFKDAQLFKCDVYSDKVVFAAPPLGGKETEDVPFERWWFPKAGTDKSAAMQVIEDGVKDPSRNGARAKIRKLNERPLELAGPWIR